MEVYTKQKQQKNTTQSVYWEIEGQNKKGTNRYINYNKNKCLKQKNMHGKYMDHLIQLNAISVLYFFFELGKILYKSQLYDFIASRF